VTAYDPLTVGCGIYVVDECHVARARWWLAAHPRTRDRAAIAAGVRRELHGLRHQDVPALMEQALADVGGEWADPATWPATWPAEWLNLPARPAAAEARVEVPDQARAQAQPAAEAPGTVIVPDRPRALAQPRDRSGYVRPSRARAVERRLPGADAAVAEPVAGVPQWAGHPVRASRIPRHLLPGAVRDVAPGARWLLWRCARGEASREMLPMEAIMAECGASRKAVQDWLAELRAAGLMLTCYDLPGRQARARRQPRTDWTPYSTVRGPRPADYARLVTDAGRQVARQLPAALTPDIGRHYRDDSDMAVLAAILHHARDCAAKGLPPIMRMSALKAVPGCDGAPRVCARLEASGVITADWHMRTYTVQLAPEVARAWGVRC